MIKRKIIINGRDFYSEISESNFVNKYGKDILIKLKSTKKLTNGLITFIYTEKARERKKKL